MRKHLLAASAAALVIATPGFADKGGGGHGGGQGGQGGQGGGHGGNGGGNRAQAVQQQRGGGNGGQAMQAQRGNRGQAMRVEAIQAQRGGGHAMRMAGNAEQRPRMHGNAQRWAAPRAVAIDRRGHDRVGEIRAARAMRGPDRQEAMHATRVAQVNDRVATVLPDRAQSVRVVTRAFDNDFGRGRGLVNGCPPGLDRKDNGCLPPGQAAKLLGAQLQQAYSSSLLPVQYRSWYRDDPNYIYRSGDGYIYQVNRSSGIVDGLIPLFGGAGDYYALGDPWPQPYNFYNVPYQYQSYYPDSAQYDYRYGDGAIYRLDNGTGVVDSIVALLAGDLGVGSRLPVGYDAYNVPFDYRDRYYDTADNWYRYNDGYIYQVDPKTRLISAVISAII